MFIKGDRIKIKPEYAGSMEDFYEIKRDTVLTVHAIETEDDQTYLIFSFGHHMYSIRIECFEHANPVGFSLDEVA
jgi:hypothetical protein